jgi:hypothetical protein
MGAAICDKGKESMNRSTMMMRIEDIDDDKYEYSSRRIEVISQDQKELEGDGVAGRDYIGGVEPRSMSK